MKLNKTYPENISVLSFDADSSGSLSMISNNSKKDCWDCSQSDASYCWCSKQCYWISVVVMLLLGVTVAALACAIIFGIPKNIPDRVCITANNQSGFQCDDHVTCLQSSQVCHRIEDCLESAHESAMCSRYCYDRFSSCI
ncbi:low-density lipoprotein receptor class A domain-containing protein 1-like isoform X1 [Stegostoma tigrinum]|uniref:low-density lipoprotein receptor class A domain-containing protein 1-like isoform X1 n=1 Tax=Stegostoma tigrinum TaxID=3053191 RepID=UPI00202B8B24|nr:low-density lipoprotein receptor class A domain-containing protein 1-like isoform X1 [Stegostoma tigrinum]